LVFSKHGELPGLRYVPEGIAKNAAISTTSNSLLSLAKIFQDSMSNASSQSLANQSSKNPQRPSGVGDILALYYLSLSLQPSPSTANNVGILLASVQQPVSAPFVHFKEASSLPAIPGVVPGSGVALALAYYNYGLNLDSKHAHLFTNLGSLLKDIGQLNAAIKMYEQAVACDGQFDIGTPYSLVQHLATSLTSSLALANLANAVKDQGRINDAIEYYRRAVASSPDFAEAVCGLANALNSVCDWTGRGGVILEGGKYDRWHVDENGMLCDAEARGTGTGWMKRVVNIVAKQLEDGANWGRGVLHEQSLRSMLQQLEIADSGNRWSDEKSINMQARLSSWAGKMWEGSRIVHLVERAIKRAMHRWYRDKFVHKKDLPSSAYSRPQLPSVLSIPGAPTVLPFHTFTCPLSAKDIRMISERNALRISCSTLKAPWLPASVYTPPPPPNPNLNIGYVSSDFNNHPLAHLMQSVFGLHDSSKVKAFCYATTASDHSAHREQIEREAPVFRDTSSWSSDRLVQQIVQDEIHILVNLNGYTRGARNEVFAARPAPIQMSFMGFAGTLGAEWCDYLLADKIAVPPETLRPWRRNVELEDQLCHDQSVEEDEWVYSENIIFCRDTFFCCDHRQSSQDSQVPWEEEQQRRWRMRKDLFPNLSNDAIILGNFNQLYKVIPCTPRHVSRLTDLLFCDTDRTYNVSYMASNIS
jgi:tetratricopeptide (TPR) repeat protein